MSIYRIVTVPDPVLREKSRPVSNINQGVLRLLDNMMDTLKSSEDGAGLAAPQIGVSKRIAVVNMGENETEDYVELINPEVVEQEGEQDHAEGCLSVPGVIGWVKRAQRVKIRALDRHGEVLELEARDFGARLLLHEIDHLDGVLFIDRASRTKRID